jgi:hypothetical protein
MASTFSAEFGAFIAAASNLVNLSVYLIYIISHAEYHSQAASNTDNDNFDDDFGIGGLFDEVRNEVDEELSNVAPSAIQDINQVEHQVGLLTVILLL